MFCFFFSSRRRHTRSYGDWSSDVCSSDLRLSELVELTPFGVRRLAAAFPAAASRGRRQRAAGAQSGAKAPHSKSSSQLLLFVLAEEAGLERIARQLSHLILGQPEGAMHGQEVVHDVAVEVRRIVRVDRHPNTALPQHAHL